MKVWLAEANQYAARVRAAAEQRRALWQRALSTAAAAVENGHALDDQDREEIAASLLGTKKKDCFWTLIDCGPSGLLRREFNLLARLRKCKHQRISRDARELVSKLKDCAADSEWMVESTQRQWQEQVLYGAWREVVFGEERTFFIWKQFVSEARGDLALALKNAARSNWTEIPETYLEWRQEKEFFFGSSDMWKEAILAAEGDESKAAIALGVGEFDYRRIVRNFGLSRFAESVRCDRKQPMLRFIIYGLRDPFTREIRWVGQSKNGMRRPQSMLTEGVIQKNKLGCGPWLRELVAIGARPEIVVLEECTSVEHLNEAERRHIAAVRYQIGRSRLTNISGGGAAGADRYVARLARRKGDHDGKLKAVKAFGGDLAKAAQFFGETSESFVQNLTSAEKEWLTALCESRHHDQQRR